MRRPPPRGAVLPALFVFPLLLLAGPLPLIGQSGPDIMRQAVELSAQRLAGVENITVVQETMGMETELYMEKREVDGVPTLVPVRSSVAGMTPPVPDFPGAGFSSSYDERWIERTRVEGTEVLDQRTMHVLVMDDFSGIDLSGFSGEGMGNMELRPARFRSLLDTELLVVRSMQMEGQIRREGGEWVPFQMDMTMDDYRETEGYLHPFSTRVRMSGMMALMGDDQQQAMAGMAEMRQQLESMPADRRAMMEGMLGDALDRIGSMMGEDGSMEIETTVQEVRVNEGMPDR